MVKNVTKMRCLSPGPFASIFIMKQFQILNVMIQPQSRGLLTMAVLGCKSPFLWKGQISRWQLLCHHFPAKDCIRNPSENPALKCALFSHCSFPSLHQMAVTHHHFLPIGSEIKVRKLKVHCRPSFSKLKEYKNWRRQ